MGTGGDTLVLRLRRLGHRGDDFSVDGRSGVEPVARTDPFTAKSALVDGLDSESSKHLLHDGRSPAMA